LPDARAPLTKIIATFYDVSATAAAWCAVRHFSLLVHYSFALLHGFSIGEMNFGKLLLSHEILINLCSQRGTAAVHE
jgi:hypothetical protein